jgi:acetoin utilization protein AcuB
VQVSEIMHREVIGVGPKDTLSLAVQTMLWTGYHQLPVIADGELYGMLSELDILRYRASQPESDPMSHSVSAAMITPVVIVSPDDSIEVAAERMTFHGVGPEWTAADVMTKAPVYSMPDEFLIDAIAKMSVAGVRHLPVLDIDHKVVGLLSDRDVRLKADDLSGPFPALRDDRMRVRAAMSRDIVSVHLNTPARVLLEAFIDWRIEALPVVDADDRMVGIVSYVDALAQMSKDRMQAS